MDKDDRGLAIIFHTSSYDRIHHGLSIALAALALGRAVRFFFTYWSLKYLLKNEPELFILDREAEENRRILEKNMEKGHIHRFSELIAQAKTMGAKFYVCSSSMGMLNIARDEFISEVDKSMGITTFLTETGADQILFI